MIMGIENLLSEIKKTSGDLWSKGWAERNAGNISIRLSQQEAEAFKGSFEASWLDLKKPVSGLEGEFFLITGTGRYIRNIPICPEENLGVIEIDNTGTKYRKIWGWTKGGNPTSEISVHLEAHSIRKSLTENKDRVIVHTHPTNLIALTYVQDLDSYSLTRLIWEMHTECIIVFPEGIEFLPWKLPGSNDIAAATSEGFKKRNLVIWQFHGAFASGPDLDTAFGLIDTADKTAGIYLKALSAGGVQNKLSSSQLSQLVTAFNLTVDQEILNRVMEESV